MNFDKHPWFSLRQPEPTVTDLAQWGGSGMASLKAMASEMALRMYGAPYSYSYLVHDACSGAARNALTAALTNPMEWDGILAKDYFELSVFILEALQYWGPMARGLITQVSWMCKFSLVMIICVAASASCLQPHPP